MGKNLGPANTTSWANMMNESSERKRKNRHATRRARGEGSRTASPVRSGDTKKVGNVLKIYTTKPIILASGKTVRGHWVTAVDPHGNYGGPYANAREMLNNPKFKSNERNLEKNRTRRSSSRSRRP